MAFQPAGGMAPSIVNSSVARTREYLTAAEIETLTAAARKSSRYGHRDATMILIAYRHGLRASEVCDLQWHQVELATGRLHVRRSKRGTPSVHPMQGDEIRALRRLQREQTPAGPQVVAQRRALAAELVASTRRDGKWDAQVSAIVNLQQAIETIDRAIQDEKASRASA